MVLQTHLESLSTLEVSRELDVHANQDIQEVIKRGPAEERLFSALCRSSKGKTLLLSLRSNLLKHNANIQQKQNPKDEALEFYSSTIQMI
jgi:hypothetical protein